MTSQRDHGYGRGLVLLAVVTALAVLGCGDDDAADSTTTTTPGQAPVTSTDADPLDGEEFVSQSVSGHELVADTAVTLAFSGGDLRASAGCNSMTGAYTLVGDELSIPGELATTLMGCEQALAEQDAWLAGWLTGGLVWSLQDSELRLDGGEVSMVLTAEPADGGGADDLLGTWELETVIDGGTASSVPAGVAAPTLEISETAISVFTGCNSGSATAQLGPEAIMVESLGLTEMACEEAAMDLEATVVGVLTAEVPYGVEGDELTLGDGSPALVWRRA
ncbi:MAG: hypothetical protein JJLCMIEE_02486 [Acidimicrobiales bacterium]|nr:hypothetical protein [Acidimicrobiales bacterium]